MAKTQSGHHRIRPRPTCGELFYLITSLKSAYNMKREKIVTYNSLIRLVSNI